MEDHPANIFLAAVTSITALTVVAATTILLDIILCAGRCLN